MQANNEFSNNETEQALEAFKTELEKIKCDITAIKIAIKVEKDGE
jgi:hypothetical protein